MSFYSTKILFTCGENCFPHMWDHSDSTCMPPIKVIILKGSNRADHGYITLSTLQNLLDQKKKKITANLSRDGGSMLPLTFHIFYYT